MGFYNKDFCYIGLHELQAIFPMDMGSFLIRDYIYVHCSGFLFTESFDSSSHQGSPCFRETPICTLTLNPQFAPA